MRCQLIALVALAPGSRLVPRADPDDIRETADEILSRPEYRAAGPSVVDRVLGWIGDRLGEILGAVVGASGGYWVGYAILGLALAAAGWFLWRVLPRGGGLQPRPGAGVVHTSRPRLSRDQWLARAREAEAAGRWSEVVHARYHALTTGLADRHQLPPEPSVTSGEHRRAFNRTDGADPARTRTFDRATERFEAVWFGGAPAAPDDVRVLAEADRDLLADRP